MKSWKSMSMRLNKNWKWSEPEPWTNKIIWNCPSKRISVLWNVNLPRTKKVGNKSKKMPKPRWKNRSLSSKTASKKTRPLSLKPWTQLPVTSKLRPPVWLLSSNRPKSREDSPLLPWWEWSTRPEPNFRPSHKAKGRKEANTTALCWDCWTELSTKARKCSEE